MYIEENAHFSLIRKLKDSFADTVKVVDSYPRNQIEVPLISVDIIRLDFTKLQIGDYNNIRNITWIVDVFAKNKTQRDRMTFQLMSTLEQKIPIYDFTNGFNNQNLIEIGAIEPKRLRVEFVEIEVENPEELFFRAIGSFNAQINF
ncbi:MAG: hypothetical protein QXV73_05380 [Candidatus Micrarchaeia archaeon]